MKIVFVVLSLVLSTSACTHGKTSAVQANFEVTQQEVSPGTKVSMQNQSVDLYAGSLKVGEKLADKLAGFDNQGKVAIVNIVPSIDTPVCEAQTHELGETGQIPSSVLRFTVSRDLPMAQMRFAKEAGLTNISYLSDYKDGSFGKRSGLMMKGPELLARGVLVVDQKGIIRHIQIVPNVAQLPDLGKAIEVSKSLL